MQTNRRIPPTARRFEPYLSRAIDRKQKEVSEMVEAQTLIKDTIYSLRPIAVKYKDKYRVFEPKYLRRRKRLTSSFMIIYGECEY